MRRMNRVLSFDADKQRVTVEAGLSLGALYDFLLPHHLYLPIQPGHPQISIGACVACNVHGKNPQRDGVFGDIVESLQLFHPAHGLLTLSRKEQPDIFELTCGGFGLTGIIVSVTLRLKELPSAHLEVRNFPVRNLREAHEQIVLQKSRFDFLYTWNDLSVFGERLGRGYVSGGRFAADAANNLMPLRLYRELNPSRTARKWRPKVLHRQLIPWLSSAAFAWQMRRSGSSQNLQEVMYPSLRRVNYFSLYGSAGFFGHMVLLPNDRAANYISKLEALVRKHREPVLVTSMKTFGGPQRLLRFNGTGVSMHFHVANSTGGRRLIDDLDGLSREMDVIRNIYFDARLSAADARRLYPEYDTFKAQLHRFDPKRLFASSLSRRLEL
jgi:decaprenylphospho-beta-D-ribofuranose 2-oxidase